MVRKINKKVKKEKPVFKFAPTVQQIDEQIDNFINFIRPLIGEEKTEMYSEMVKNNSNIHFMPKAMRLAHVYNQIGKKYEGNEKFNKDMIESLEELFKDFKENYFPKMSTILYMNLFALNKIVARYFKVNIYRKRFSAKNENKTYQPETYKKFNSLIKNRPIIADKEKVFEGIWIEKIVEISKKLDKILHRLDQYRETFIVEEKIIEEYKNVKKTLTLQFSETKPLNKSEKNYIKKIFGDTPLAEEVRRARTDEVTEIYKSEYNFIIDMYLYLTLIESESNYKFLIKELTMMTSNRFLAEDVEMQIREIVQLVHTFVKNFDNLVCEGEDKFDPMLKGFAVGEEKNILYTKS